MRSMEWLKPCFQPGLESRFHLLDFSVVARSGPGGECIVVPASAAGDAWGFPDPPVIQIQQMDRYSNPHRPPPRIPPVASCLRG